MPSFTCEIAEVLSPTNPLGIKAGGEGGTTGAPAGGGERHRRCAVGLWHPQHHDAGDAVHYLEDDPGREGKALSCRPGITEHGESQAKPELAFKASIV